MDLRTSCVTASCRFPGHAVVATEFTREALSSGTGLFEYGTEAFTRLACARPTYLQTILDLGYSVVWSDTDTVWLQDFLKLTPHVRTHSAVPRACTKQQHHAWSRVAELVQHLGSIRCWKRAVGRYSMCLPIIFSKEAHRQQLPACPRDPM